MTGVKVKLSIKGIREVLKSSPVQSEVARRAKRIAAAAGEGFEAVVKPHKYTSRAFVQTESNEGRQRQADDAVLERSTDAGR
jgi:hypothetical protein